MRKANQEAFTQEDIKKILDNHFIQYNKSDLELLEEVFNKEDQYPSRVSAFICDHFGRSRRGTSYSIAQAISSKMGATSWV